MSTTTFENVRVFDGETVHQSATVVVQDGKIASISTSGSSTPASGKDAVTFDGAGHTLLPGLIEAHMHAHLPPGAGPELLESAIASGLTTILDMHNSPKAINELKDACRKSAKLPDLKSSNYGATIDGGWPKPIVLHHDPSEESKADVATWPNLTPETAEDFVRSNKAQGADYIKLMQENGHSMAFPGIPVASLELQTALVEAAHKHGLLALAHATNIEETLLVLKAGVDALTHAFSDKAPTPELTEAFKEKNAFLIPTLTVVSSLTGEEQELRDKFAAKATPEQLTDPVKKNMVACLKLRVGDATVKNAYAQVKQLKAAGIDIVAGTDSVPDLLGTAIGPSFAQELYMYVERCGFSPVEALHSATALPAKRFGFKDRGRIAEGLRADLLLVKGDPTSNIEDICNVAGVWKAGQISFESKA